MWSEPGGVPNPSSLCWRLPATTNVSNYTHGMQQMRHRVISRQESLSPFACCWVLAAGCTYCSAQPFLPHTTGMLSPLRILVSPRSGGSLLCSQDCLGLTQRSAVVPVPRGRGCGGAAICLPAQTRCFVNQQGSSFHL